MSMQNYKESFRNIFDQTIKGQSGARSIKIEVQGILAPCVKSIKEKRFRYKLATDSHEYFLHFNETQKQLAKNIEWEEVIVKGLLEPISNIIEVQKISRSQKNEPPRPLNTWADCYFELEKFKQDVDRRGKLELAPDYWPI